jgi:uncharacterized coiled-coil DUF342 family protein
MTCFLPESPSARFRQIRTHTQEEKRLSESLEQRIRKLNQELASLEEERGKLNLEANKWAEKRNSIHEKIKQLRTEATSLKKRRDILNEEVQKLKSLREKAKTKRKEKLAQISKSKEKIKSLMERKPSPSMHSIQREIEKLEWKIQTTSLPVKEEETLVNQVRQLEAQLLIHKQIEKSKEEFMVQRTEEKALGTKVKTCHEKLSELAEQSQEFHEKMLETLNKVHSLRVQADGAHQEYVEIKQQAQNLHQKCAALLDTIQNFEKKVQEVEEKKQAKRQRELRKEVEERALEKLRCGEKLTWDEFKILAEKKKI